MTLSDQIVKVDDRTKSAIDLCLLTVKCNFPGSLVYNWTLICPNKRMQRVVRSPVGLQVFLYGGIFSMKSVYTDEEEIASNWEVVVLLFYVTTLSLAIIAETNNVIAFWSTNKESVLETVCGGMETVLSAVEGIRLYQKRKDLRHVLHRFGTMWDNAYESEEHRSMMVEQAKRASSVAYFVFVNLCIAIGSYAINPYRTFLVQYFITKNENNTYNYTTAIPALYPINYNSWKQVFSIVMFENITLFPILIYIANANTLLGQLVTHLTIHFQILRHDLENINQNTDNVSVEDQNVAVKKFVKIIGRHCELHQLYEMIETTYSPMLLFTVVSRSVVVCLCMREIQFMISIDNYAEAWKYTFTLISVICETLICCGYANLLTEQALLLAESAYNCPWYMLGKQFGFLILIVIMKAQRPAYMTAYHFFPLSLELFTTIISTAASYFTLLTSVM